MPGEISASFLASALDLDTSGAPDRFTDDDGSRYLYLGGRRLTCVELGTGRRMWEVDVPESPTWLGRGLVSEQRIVLPGMTHWQHPSFFAYFPGNSSPPSVP